MASSEGTATAIAMGAWTPFCSITISSAAGTARVIIGARTSAAVTRSLHGRSPLVISA